MKPAPFAFHRPASLADALACLATGEARPLAGGQSLVPMLNLRLTPVDALVELRGVPELAGATETPDGAVYGALLTHAAFEDGQVPDVTRGLMRHVAGGIAYRAVRNRGTIGGALALADPAADWLTTVVALDAEIGIAGAAGTRWVRAEDFVLGPYFTVLEPTELLTAVRVRRLPQTTRWGVCKVAVKVGEYAETLVVALIDPARGESRVVLGALDGAPLLLPATAAAAGAGTAKAALEQTVAVELAGSDRDFTPADLLLHATAVTRAIAEARS
ncbi:FAD binding domain-containing protein [Aquabacter spiritensis]|uniref:Carbon-monoxide dehydrogenase medium subunit n=1 Tax=Aquabacter spiritensis TaxID=933073 RepID=A0A4R3LMV7_9HYPH|nr:FAD binding domain-containing protein [Aquabacter spiritensis]TCT01733.1 carbon-monoxide dehydrogenase medium subunit [Aquabacter spiritensis]